MANENETLMIDLTPEVLKTLEGRIRVDEAMTVWQSSQKEVANEAMFFFREHGDTVQALLRMNATEYPSDAVDDLSELKAKIAAMNTKQEAFLRAFMGRE